LGASLPFKGGFDPRLAGRAVQEDAKYGARDFAKHCSRWLDGQPELAGIPADTIRAALASVVPGEPPSLFPEEPKPSLSALAFS